MITIKDNFLDFDNYQKVLNYCTDEAEFNSYKVGDKLFHCTLDNTAWLSHLILSHLGAEKYRHVFSYFRIATSRLDTDWRIHCDSEIMGEQPTHACVLYITENKQKPNGTAFWEHEDYGMYCPELAIEEFDRLIIEDSNKMDKWKMSNYIDGRANRLLTYPTNIFHSKYPNVAWGNDQSDCRIIFCMFYKQTKGGAL